MPAPIMADHFDALETRDPEERERAVFARLPLQIAHAKSNAPQGLQRKIA